jgi:hypothetical protein
MVRRVVAVLVLGVLAVSWIAPSAVAGRPPLPSIASVSFEQVTLPPGWTASECGFRVSATFADVGHGRIWAEFGMHTPVWDTTFYRYERLAEGQTSASFTIGSPIEGDTLDVAQVTLYRGGRELDTETITKTVTCPAV